MIQRMQSVWLLLAAVAVFLTIKLPFYSGRAAADGQFLSLDGTSSIIILILSSALGTCIVVTIFLFKNRKLQIRLNILCILVEALIIYLYIRQIQTVYGQEGGLGLFSILHPLILLFLVLAFRGIYKDAKLIKASNRIR